MSNFVPNSFQVPNAFVDEVLNKISDAACKIYLVICRKTRGWNKEMDSISLTQFEEITGKSRPTVVKCLNELIKVGLVVEQPSTIHGNTFKLGNDTSVGLVLKFPSKNFLPLLVKIFNTQSITIKNNSQSNKKINKKRGSVSEKPKTEKPNEFNPRSVELPACVDSELWNNFVDMRISIKKPLSENAVKLILKKLISFGPLANQSLENSIIGNYQGVFEPRQNQIQENPQSHNVPEEPGYFTQMYAESNRSNVIDVTPVSQDFGGY
ncbi:TPA: replication protein [Acinetobacter baumannii]|nr:replication protein [Acinetobacter baumannii]EKV1440450.1 replication protein [Acinetobacter baumannii]EKV3928195.1 replication protein [Acinetobacter baumannii]MDO8810168.1 replication protein [Acinetobacter baumannii]HCT2710293.1 replication protein [Acinetobacter baumannii]